MHPMAAVFVVLLVVIGAVSIRSQVRQLRELASGPAMASDDRSYLRRRAWRRLVNAGFLLVLAGMIAGTYLSGMEQRAEELRPQVREAKGEMTPEQKDFFRFYAMYWIGIILLIFLVISVAIVDIWATRRYAWNQLKRIRDDHRALLERDLALYRQQRANQRFRTSRDEG